MSNVSSCVKTESKAPLLFIFMSQLNNNWFGFAILKLGYMEYKLNILSVTNLF